MPMHIRRLRLPTVDFTCYACGCSIHVIYISTKYKLSIILTLHTDITLDYNNHELGILQWYNYEKHVSKLTGGVWIVNGIAHYRDFCVGGGGLTH